MRNNNDQRRGKRPEANRYGKENVGESRPESRTGKDGYRSNRNSSGNRDSFHKKPEGKPIDAIRDMGEEEEFVENRVEGKNPVLEVLRSDHTVEKLLVARGMTEGSIREIIGKARDKGIIIQEVERQRLDEISAFGAHQGVIAYVTPYAYVAVDDMIKGAKAKGEDPLLIILDEITDPHNLGAIIRTAESCGAHGVIIPKRRAVGLTPAVVKASAGAVEYLPVAKVTNLASLLEDLKQKGIWIAGADRSGESYTKGNLSGPLALVIGSEGSGIGRLIKERCDFLIKIPMKGQIDSLNASVAAGILMYEVVRQRG